MTYQVLQEKLHHWLGEEVDAPASGQLLRQAAEDQSHVPGHGGLDAIDVGPLEEALVQEVHVLLPLNEIVFVVAITQITSRYDLSSLT